MTRKKTKSYGGFTLTEVVVTIIIVGVLASLALPRFNVVFERVRAAEGVQILTALLQAQKAYEVEWGVYSTSLGILDVEIDRASNFNLPPTVANPANPLANPIATIQRTGSYTLGINENGDILCTDGGGGFTCAEAGF
ncbi:MAG: prepilin-type N-terminal cleavage/methylation domain-containing protein [Candidatus Omnitrophica bacterium]|nr:prepilin-type N-terminal cleavage/methylation domain-containing protein [Candidatus Omnitrophota bacterium]